MTTTLASVALAALLTSCGGGANEGDAAAEPTTSPTSETSEPEATAPTKTKEADPYAPNLGKRALRVGQTRVGSEITTTLDEVRIPYPPGEYRTPERGNVFAGLRLTQCLDKKARRGKTSYNSEFYLVTPQGAEYGGDGSSWNDWPAPKFPELVGMVPGRCVQGWISLQMPEGTKVESILFRPSGTPIAEWLLKG